MKKDINDIDKQIAELKAKINKDKEALNALRAKKQQAKEAAKKESK